MSFIDLSYSLQHHEAIFPGDPAFELNEIRSVEKDGFSDYLVKGGMHVGTHIDAPGHIFSGGKLISDYPVSKFIGSAICVDARDVQSINIDLMKAHDVKADDIVLLHTGHNVYYSDNAYFKDHPVVSHECAQWLIDNSIKMLGMDMPSPDKSPYEVHKMLLGNDILLIENLKNLSMLSYKVRYEFWGLPVSINASASWIRAVVKLD